MSGITLANSFNGSGGNPPGSATSPTSIPIGDVIVCVIYSANGQGSPGSIVVSDNVNTGNYAQVGAPYFDAANGVISAAYYKRTNAAGTPTVSASIANEFYGSLSCMQLTGFVGIPTVDTGIYGTFGSDTAVATATLSPITNGFANEFIFTTLGPGGTGYAYPAPNGNWQQIANNLFYVSVSATGQNNAIVAQNLNSTRIWNGIVGGIYDNPASAQPLANYQLQPMVAT